MFITILLLWAVFTLTMLAILVPVMGELNRMACEMDNIHNDIQEELNAYKQINNEHKQEHVDKEV